ncbi:hypothetical protein [Pseudenhygromyxa sp. WMMC2535]|nr:hypothetical protein [Pseudenhygromyxa sp. WMMC2535]
MHVATASTPSRPSARSSVEASSSGFTTGSEGTFHGLLIEGS